MITSNPPVVKPTARYSIKETCTLLGIHRNTLRAKFLSGEIKGVQKKRGQRFVGTEILRFWKSQV